MAKTKREFIFATFVISCLATVLTIVSIATEEWVVSDVLAVKITNGKTSFANYGLFNGVFQKRILESGISNTVAVACLFGENICGFSNSLTKESRETELRQLLDGNVCIKPKSFIIYRDYDTDNLSIFSIFGKKSENTFYETTDTTNTSTASTQPSAGLTFECDLKFLNAGLWLTTIILMILATLFGGISAFFSVVNTSINPINQWHSIWGLYIWNGIAAASHLLAMILWGAQFEASVKNNIGITDTLRGEFTSDGLANLGYSYWIIFPAMFLHVINMGIFYLRQYLINKEPAVPTLENNVDKDGMLFVY